MKRILSFDGGGIRGIFSLQIAARIEQLFREEHGRNDLVLADVVDLFAGTSTGAIISTCLAWGMPVAEVERLYISHGKQMFAKVWFWQRLKSKFRAVEIASFFKEIFKEEDGSPALLSSSKIRTKLLVVMANATTGSAWPICNNPDAMFNDPSREDCNMNVPLWQLVRASTAAPTYFPPEQIKLGSQKFLFVDGGTTPYNNPALLAAFLATLPCYKLEWPGGRDNLHLTSIGTGSQRTHYSNSMPGKIYYWNSVGFTVGGLMGTISLNQDMVCRVLGHCVHGALLDLELGCLDVPSLFQSHEQKFTYARYDCRMDSSEVGDPLTPNELMLDNLGAMSRLQQIGREYADAQVKREHFFAQITMIVDGLNHLADYGALHPAFASAAWYVRENDLLALPIGRHEIDEHLFVIRADNVTKQLSDSFWEAHRTFGDIHVMLEGAERIGYAPIETMTALNEYNADRDEIRFSGTGEFLTLRPGQFLIVGPRDVHMPGQVVDGKPAAVKKVVFNGAFERGL